ncbi:hypothetical protein B5X24_HaOG212923 [Helicoverpa armigera]|nr:hypothetical protein B5X24_HaOG212923 [Helicoverpa armigera]
MLINDKSYALHVKKLKEVNGLKRHNLKVEGMGLRSHPIVYINNPVESAVPNAYLTIDQFKNAMIHKAEDKKKEFNNEFIHKNQKTEKPKKEAKKVKHRAKATTKAHSERTTKTTLKQNVTDAKFETKSVTEIPTNVTETPTNVTEEPTIVTETPIVTDTITTVTEPSTTETTTVKTKRTKQARPYVFMGGS